MFFVGFYDFYDVIILSIFYLLTTLVGTPKGTERQGIQFIIFFKKMSSLHLSLGDWGMPILCGRL